MSASPGPRPGPATTNAARPNPHRPGEPPARPSESVIVKYESYYAETPISVQIVVRAATADDAADAVADAANRALRQLDHINHPTEGETE